MYLDYSKLEFDADGHIDPPELMLQTLNGEDIGTIIGVHNLSINIKFVEQSVMEFDVPRALDGRENLLYEQITGYKLIHTLHYGDYVTMNPKKTSDGIAETKHVTAYSIEKLLEKKKFFLEEGVYKLCNVANIDDPGTIIGRIREIDPTWNIGDIDPLYLAGKYAVFDSYDGELYDFMMNNVMQKYRCVFVFDPYGTPGKPGKTINIYSADQTRKNLGIYLDFDNLLTETDVEEVSDEMITAIRPYGADELSILDVNPTGDNWVYDLSGFIARGDLGDPNDGGSLAAKFIAWQHRVLIKRPEYRALTAARASAWQRYYTETAKLNELQGQLDSLLVQQNVAIQGNEPTLPTITDEIGDKTTAVNEQKNVVEAIYKEGDATCDIGRLNSEINALVNGTGTADALAIRRAFTDSEYQQLLPFILQQDVTDDTFYASEISADMTPASSVNVNGKTLTISGSHIESTSITSGYPCTIYTISGGTLSGSFDVQGDGNTTQVKQLTANIVRGTLEMLGDLKFTLSLYTGTVSVGDKSADDGLLTVSGTYVTSGCSTNVVPVIENGVAINVGNSVTVATNEAKLYLTASAGEFQKWAVEQQLYDYAVDILADVAQPTYQFSVESGNFLFVREFAPFRNELELGCGVYLNLPGEQTITPYLIELSVDFENPDKFTLLFSNRFKRKDNVNTLKDIIEKSYSAGRSFDLSKHGYRTAEGDATDAAKFIRSSLDFAKNRIQSASNQSVVIDGAGIRIGGESNRQMRIVNDMIAITDDGWQSAKLAIGYFKNASGTNYFGVNAGVIAGNLIIGEGLHISTGDNGFFSVDEYGVKIDSAKFQITHGGNYQNIDTVLGEYANSAENKAAQDLYNALNAENANVSDPNTTVFYEAADPSTQAGGSHAVETNDLWYLTANNITVNGTTYNAGAIFKRSGSSWVAQNNSALRLALDNAKKAQDTADSKVTSWRIPADSSVVYGTKSPPLKKVTDPNSPWYGFDPIHAEGDLWYNSTNALPGVAIFCDDPEPVTVVYVRSDFDTDEAANKVLDTYGRYTVTFDPDKLYRFNGSTWGLVEDGDIAPMKSQVGTLSNELHTFYTNGVVSASAINGTIGATHKLMLNSSGTVRFDNKGMWLLRYGGDNFKQLSDNYAVWMNEYGILFGKKTSRAASGSLAQLGAGTITSYVDDDGWEWTTAINHEGVTANAIAAGRVTGLNLYGGDIRIGQISSAGGDDFSNFNFYVKNNGDLYAASGTFKGTLEAAKIKGNITPNGNGWLIGCGLKIGGVISNNDNDIADPNFMVDASGNVTMKGNITLGGPNSTITWGSGSSPAQVLYAAYAYAKPTSSYSSYPDSYYYGWHKIMDTTNDKYASYTYDGGNTWTNAIKVVGTDGVNGQNGRDANVTYNNILTALQTASSTQQTFITADATGSPNIYGANIYGGTIYTNDLGIYPRNGNDADSGSLSLYAHSTAMFQVSYSFPGSVIISTQGTTYVNGNYIFTGTISCTGTNNLKATFA